MLNRFWKSLILKDFLKVIRVSLLIFGVLLAEMRNSGRRWGVRSFTWS